MHSVDDATRIVLSHTAVLTAQRVSLGPEHLGCVLAEDVASDMDMPPFDKALMDGYAVRVVDVRSGTSLPVAGMVTAGQMPPRLPEGSAIRIMTGAPIPPGADAIVRLEETTTLDDGRVRFDGSPLVAGQNILSRGAEMRTGEIVLSAGTRITPQVAGLLAAVGRTEVRLIPRPEAAILSTGDELVPPEEHPGLGQLRNSNGPMLAFQVWRAGAKPRLLGIARDRHDELRRRIQDALASDIIILSGGVSMGQLDLVPEVLRDLGVVSHVHRVAMKPGKPFYFGTLADRLVFGLPGNPVSSYCCFELFVRPAIDKRRGWERVEPAWVDAELAEEFRHKSDRPTYHPAIRDGSLVRPIAWLGSPDLRALAQANALMRLPAGSHTFSVGARVPILDIGP